LSVFDRASYLALNEGLDEEMQEIIQLAALFHDTGFVKQYDKNEPIGAQIAEKWLKEQNYPEDKIDIIKQIILATELNSPTLNKLEEIIKDADMDNL
jgi:HD superfamily phosphodiesterase